MQMATSSYKTKLIKFSTYSLFFILVCNLNAVSTSLLGIKQVFSPLILVFSFLIIALTIQQKEWNWSIRIVILFYILHYSIGLLVRLFLIDDYDYRIPIKEVFFQCVTSLIIILAVYKATVFFIKTNSFQPFLNSLISAFTISLSIVLFCFITGWTPVQGIAVEDRGGGFFANPNEAGTAANLGLSLVMLRLLTSTQNKLLNILLLVLFMSASFLSFSKMAIIITLVLLLLFFIYSIIAFNKIPPVNRIILFSLISFISFIFIYFFINIDLLITEFSPEQGRRIKGILSLLIEREINSNTTSERDIIAYIALDLISIRPFMGYGFGFFQQGLDSSDHGVHNTHLQIIGETGIPIYTIYLSIFLNWGFKALLANRKAISFYIVVVILTILMNNIASHNDLYNRIINLYFGVVCGVITFYRANFKI